MRYGKRRAHLLVLRAAAASAHAGGEERPLLLPQVPREARQRVRDACVCGQKRKRPLTAFRPERQWAPQKRSASTGARRLRGCARSRWGGGAREDHREGLRWCSHLSQTSARRMFPTAHLDLDVCCGAPSRPATRRNRFATLEPCWLRRNSSGGSDEQGIGGWDALEALSPHRGRELLHGS